MSYNAGVTPTSISNYNPEFVLLKRNLQPAVAQNMPHMPDMNKNSLNNYSIDKSYSNKGIDYVINAMKFNTTTTTTYHPTRDYNVDTTNKNIDHLINYVAEKKQ